MIHIYMCRERERKDRWVTFKRGCCTHTLTQDLTIFWMKGIPARALERQYSNSLVSLHLSTLWSTTFHFRILES